MEVGTHFRNEIKSTFEFDPRDPDEITYVQCHGSTASWIFNFPEPCVRVRKLLLGARARAISLAFVLRVQSVVQNLYLQPRV